MKGRTIIELTDVNTKEVKRIEDCNMFTNALDSVFNKIPCWQFNSAVADPSHFSWSELNSLIPIVGNALGGLLLFPNEMEENPERIFAPASNKPTGIASFDGYAGEDTRRGSFNSIESGKLANGYRFVWDFPTSAGNGNISCVCLTSKKGGAGYFNSGDQIVKDNTPSPHAFRPSGVYYFNQAVARNSYPFGADNKGIYIKDYEKRILRQRMPLDRYTLLGNYSEFDELGFVDDDGSPMLYDGKICIVRNPTNNSGNASVTIDMYDPDTWEKTTRTLTFSAQIYASHMWRSTCVSNGYLYLLGATRRNYYKVKLDNLADVQEIPLTFEANPERYGSLTAWNNGAIGSQAIIEEDNTAFNINLRNTIPFAVHGVWLMCGIATTGSDTKEMNIGCTCLMPYLATINNLSTPVVKGATQTMKVTYIVTED